jgi:DNA-binding NarL/FixJ family response regulator
VVSWVETPSIKEGLALGSCSKPSEALHPAKASKLGKIDQLSRREFQVAEHAAQGEGNKQIADQLGLSEHAVKNYLFHVFEKLGVSNIIELLFLLLQVPRAGCESRGNGK